MNRVEKIKKIVADQLNVSVDTINDDTNFIDDLGADSLDAVELVMVIEEEFNIEISDEDAENILTVNDALKIIDKLK